MKKIYFFAFVMLFTISFIRIDTYASEASGVEVITTGQVISPMSSDIIEIKTRINNGVFQYRRWNATKKVWVDPNWINY